MTHRANHELHGDTLSVCDGDHEKCCPCRYEPVAKCRYGVAGDRLWVRETWRTSMRLDDKSPKAMAAQALAAGYSAPWAPVEYLADGHRTNWDAIWDGPGKTRTALYMPRWLSRITLELTELRVERLQNLTEEDALAEGVKPREGTGGFNVFTEDGASYWTGAEPVRGEDGVRDFVPAKPLFGASAREVYAELWDRINGKRAPWKANPLIWVISFKRVEQKQEAA